jgi:hypothetical protein
MGAHNYYEDYAKRKGWVGQISEETLSAFDILSEEAGFPGSGSVLEIGNGRRRRRTRATEAGSICVEEVRRNSSV